MTTLWHVDRQRVIVPDLEMATDRQARARGLIGHRPLHIGQGMLIRPCRWIHMFGMGFPIDVLYVSRAGRVVACTEKIAPGRIDRPVLSAHYVVELAAGSIHHFGVQVGDRLMLQEVRA